MNTKINQFVEQCTTLWEGGNGQFVSQFDELKFAELIVRECALIAGLMEHEGRSNIGANILDSFGVDL